MPQTVTLTLDGHAPKLQAEAPRHYSMAGFVVSYCLQLPLCFSLHDVAFFSSRSILTMEAASEAASLRRDRVLGRAGPERDVVGPLVDFGVCSFRLLLTPARRCGLLSLGRTFCLRKFARGRLTSYCP